MILSFSGGHVIVFSDVLSAEEFKAASSARDLGDDMVRKAAEYREATWKSS